MKVKQFDNLEEKRKNLGQYFTTSPDLQKNILKFILNSPKTILEPSIGRGDLVSYVKNEMSEVNFDMFEIDGDIEFLEDLGGEVNICDFLKFTCDKKYTTIIGNPPYVRGSKNNIYLDFVEKCVSLLEDEGELIFIAPTDFFKLTSNSCLIDKILRMGTFSHIYHPNNEKLFKGAVVDVVIFRYQKTDIPAERTLYNGIEKHLINSGGMVTWSEKSKLGSKKLCDYFDVYVGMVSGREKVYKNSDLGNIKVLNGDGKEDKYIYVTEWPPKNKNVEVYLEKYKSILKSRKIRNFTENNWFEWGALRNISVMEENKGKPCIYIHTLTRKETVAFKGDVGYFGGGLIMLLPKSDIDLDRVVKYLNSDDFKSNFLYSNRFKIGHRQLQQSYLE